MYLLELQVVASARIRGTAISRNSVFQDDPRALLIESAPRAPG